MPTESLLASQIERYLLSLSPNDKKGYQIAKDHLGCSFQIEKSNGFLQWLKKQNATSLHANTSIS
jgi:hypothetical protein